MTFRALSDRSISDALNKLALAISKHQSEAPRDKRFDLVIFDAPPRLSLATANAMKAASHLLVPVRAELLSLEGLQQLLNRFAALQDQLGTNIKLARVVFSHMPGTATKLAADARMAASRYRYGKTTIERKIWQGHIPLLTAIGAPQPGLPAAYCGSGQTHVQVHKIYDQLAQDVLEDMDLL